MRTPVPGPVSLEDLRSPSHGAEPAIVGRFGVGGGGGADYQLWDPYPDDSHSIFILRAAMGNPNIYSHGYIATNIYTES